VISRQAATSTRSCRSDLPEDSESGTGSNEDQDVISTGSDEDQDKTATGSNEDQHKTSTGSDEDQDERGAGSDEDMDEISASSGEDNNEIGTHRDEDQDGISSNSDTDQSGNTNQGSCAGDCEAMSVDNCNGDDHNKFDGPSSPRPAPRKTVGLTANRIAADGTFSTATAEAKNITDNPTAIAEMTAMKPNIVSAIAASLATTGNVQISYPIVGIATSGSGSVSVSKGPDPGPGLIPITVSVSATLDQGDAAPTTPQSESWCTSRS